jgi:hypothetical protein
MMSKLDWDRARRETRAAKPKTKPPRPPKRKRRPDDLIDVRKPVHVERLRATWRLIKRFRDHPRVTPWEREFMGKVWDEMTMCHEHTRLSDRHIELLDRIADKVRKP